MVENWSTGPGAVILLMIPSWKVNVRPMTLSRTFFSSKLDSNILAGRYRVGKTSTSVLQQRLPRDQTRIHKSHSVQNTRMVWGLNWMTENSKEPSTWARGTWSRHRLYMAWLNKYSMYVLSNSEGVQFDTRWQSKTIQHVTPPSITENPQQSRKQSKRFYACPLMYI